MVLPVLAACGTGPQTDRITTEETASYYVDGAVSHSGDGTSWAAAWKNFSDIQWATLNAGSIIYVSGGTSSRTYTETLVVEASGLEGRPVTVTRGEDIGHGGAVIIDGQYAREYGVVVDGQNHIVVRGFEVRNHIDAGIRVVSATAAVIIEENIVDSGAPNLGGNARGFEVRDSRGALPVILRNNRYTTATSTNDQTDGIWSSDNEGVLYQGNRIIISNSFAASDVVHNDCLQSFHDYKIEIIGNYCEQDNAKTGHNQGIFIQDPYSGVFLVHNNVLYAPGTNSHQIILENRTVEFAGILHAYNNTVYGGAYGSIRILNSPQSIIKNNILASVMPGAQALKIEGPQISPPSVDYNLIYTPDSQYPVYVSEGDTLQRREWRALGYDIHSVFANPMFKSIEGRDFLLQAASPAIDAGTPLAEITVDYRGIARPQGSAYDIGAFESAPLSLAPQPAM
jgi:hypothetical protein